MKGVAYEDGYDIRVLTLLGDPSTEAMQKSQVWLWVTCGFGERVKT